MDTAITPMGIRKNGPAAFGRRVAKIITIRMNSPVIMPVLTSMAVWNLLKTSIVALLYLLESAKILFALTHFLYCLRSGAGRGPYGQRPSCKV